MTFGRLGTLFDGPHATPVRRDTGPYFLNIASLNSGRLDLNESDHVSEEDFEKWTRRVTPQVDDLLFSYETRLGEAALMPPGVRACLGRRMALLRPDRDIVVPRFLLYYFLSPAFQQVVQARQIHGATVPRILLSEMPSWEVAIPTLRDQTAIAEVLGALDDKIAANTALAKTLDAIVRAWFLGQQLLSESSLWTSTELVEFNPRCAALAESPPYVDMQKLPTEGGQVTDWQERVALGGARFQNGDTLLARITPCLENGKTGYVDFLRAGETGVGSTEYIVMRSRGDLPKPLSYLLARDEGFRDFAIQHMVGTSGRQRVSSDALQQFTVRLPPLERLAESGQFLGAFFSLLAGLRDESGTLKLLRDTLLPLLMSGQVRVRDAERAVEGVL